MISLKNVSFQYAGNHAGGLKNIHMEIADGECVLLCGRSGCGKTTVLRLINGLIPDYYDGELSGEVLYQGKNISDMEMYERAKFAGSVFQNPRTQFFNVDTDSEIAFGMENLSLPRQTMLQRMEEVTEKLRLQALRRRSIFELSGGEKQRIAFASVYAMNPEVYLLDEPSSNLDTTSVEELKEQLKVIKEEGKTILISEHRIYYLMDVVDRVIYLDNGEIKAEFTRKEFLALSDKQRIEMGLRTIRKVAIQVKAYAGKALDDRALLFEQVAIRRGKRVLQQNLNFAVKEGDILGIVGENGAGKTTFLRTVCGLHKEYEGQIRMEGRLVKRKELIRQSYMVMQDVNYELFGDSVGRECHMGMKNAEEELIRQTLQELALEPYKDRHPNTLSGGQKQRVAVAVSRICGKRLLTFDEPTSGLDYDSMIQVAGMIRRLAEDAMIILVTHDIEFLNTVCTEILEWKKEK